MALQTSGPISINDLKAEFSSSSNNLRAYLKNAGIVPNIPDNSAVPTSGALSLTDFYGAVNADVTPNSVNWTNITGADFGTSNTQTISGIDTDITISVSYTGNIFLVTYVNSTIETTPLTISNNDTIYFTASAFGGGSGSVTVTNNADANTVLDTFSVTLTDGNP
jgi:hypothetical protein